MGKKKGGRSGGKPNANPSSALTAAQAKKIVDCEPGAYEALLEKKVAAARATLSEVIELPEDTKVYASPPEHFRLRCNFSLWHEPDGATVNFVMRDPDDEKRRPLKVETFPRGCRRTQELMDGVRKAFSEVEVLRNRVSEARFHTTLRGNALVLLTYNRPLDGDDKWLEAAKALSDSLGNDTVIVGRSSKVRVSAGGPESEDGVPRVDETLNVEGFGDVKLWQVEGEFSQPNGAICEKMVAWALEATKGSESRDLLELYCGNGNFSVPLSKNFRTVLATETSMANTKNARENAERNGRANLKFARLSAAEAAEALAPGARTFKRLTEVEVDLKAMDFSTLLVDPPRAGLDAAAIAVARAFETVVYVSCNPETMADDLHLLSNTHTVERVAVFDQFPYTDHCEAGVVLKRRGDADDAEEPEPREKKKKAKSRRYQKHRGGGGGRDKKGGKRKKGGGGPPGKKPKTEEKKDGCAIC